MKRFLTCSLLSITLFSSFNIFAQNKISNESVDPNLVISVHQDITIPSNVIHVLKDSSVTFDHDSGIDWDNGYRTVWGETQAKQGNIKLDSYTRARFETYPFGLPYLDSGRVWSTNQGKSFARSGKEKYDALDSGVAKTYYGI